VKKANEYVGAGVPQAVTALVFDERELRVDALDDWSRRGLRQENARSAMLSAVSRVTVSILLVLSI
jgi:hypothetical protein